MRKLSLMLSILAAAAGHSAHAQAVLLADTALSTGTNASGAPISAIPTGATNFGLLFNETSFYRLADDFTIPAGETWKIDSFITYGYQTGSTPAASTFTAGYVRVYNGNPSAGGTLIAGDTTTNRLVSSSFSGIYRVNTNTSTDVTRPLMRLRMSVPATMPAMLSAGTYWISWSAKGSLASGPFTPAKVLPAATLPPSQNGLQNDTGSWNGSFEGSTAIGLNMILKGSKTTTGVGNAALQVATRLNAAYPNPVPQGTSATLAFSLGARSRVSLRILNAVGQRVATVVEDELTAGEYMLPFSTANLAAGAYRIVLQTDAGSNVVPLTVK